MSSLRGKYARRDFCVTKQVAKITRKASLIFFLSFHQFSLSLHLLLIFVIIKKATQVKMSEAPQQSEKLFECNLIIMTADKTFLVTSLKFL